LAEETGSGRGQVIEFEKAKSKSAFKQP